MSAMKRVLLAIAVLVLGLGAIADAQLRGFGRIQGTVVDENGTPLTAVVVKATLPGSNGSIDSASDKKGEWSIGGMARGEWDVTFEKPGYAPRRAKVSLVIELTRIPPIAVSMKKS
jgi:hypothetical protein